jgi:hypothetical protein
MYVDVIPRLAEGSTDRLVESLTMAVEHAILNVLTPLTAEERRVLEAFRAQQSNLKNNGRRAHEAIGAALYANHPA